MDDEFSWILDCRVEVTGLNSDYHIDGNYIDSTLVLGIVNAVDAEIIIGVYLLSLYLYWNNCTQ